MTVIAKSLSNALSWALFVFIVGGAAYLWWRLKHEHNDNEKALREIYNDEMQQNLADIHNTISHESLDKLVREANDDYRKGSK